MGGDPTPFLFQSAKTPPGRGYPPMSAPNRNWANIGGYPPPRRGTPLYMLQKSSRYAMSECQKTVSPQSRRPERPRSSRDHHSKPLGTICHSSTSTFSVCNTKVASGIPDAGIRDPGCRIPDPPTTSNRAPDERTPDPVHQPVHQNCKFLPAQILL